jgi:hypothetical protein
MRKFVALMSCSCLAVLLALSTGSADEEKVPLDKVPKAVLDSVKAKYEGAKLLGAAKEKDGDKIVFEIELTFKEHHYDVTVEPEGKIVGIEKTITTKELPEAIGRAIEAKYPKATWKRIEELAKGDGKVTGYEILLVTAAKETIEVVLDPAGKITKEEKAGAKEGK